MERYPLVEVNVKNIISNAKFTVKMLKEKGITCSGIIKGFGGYKDAAFAMAEGGCVEIGSSRIEQLRDMRQAGMTNPLLLIRLPMFCEIPEVIEYSDISLNSEAETLILLNEEAKKQGKLHKVLLMYDLGDLREGVFTCEKLLELALLVENQLPNLILDGVATNLNCYGSVAPSTKNLTALADAAILIEEKIGRTLTTVSGGGSTSIPLLLTEGFPEKINHLRIGELIANAQDLELYWDFYVDGLNKETFILKAQIIELNEKPTFPIGNLMVDAFGKKGNYEDRGVRKRALVAIGNQDLWEAFKLIPKDKQIKILGSSSDHTILDIEDCDYKYQLGDIVEFNMLYQAVLFATLSETVYKKTVR